MPMNCLASEDELGVMTVEMPPLTFLARQISPRSSSVFFLFPVFSPLEDPLKVVSTSHKLTSTSLPPIAKLEA